MASTLFRFRHAAIALSECAPSLAVLESTLLKSHNISRPLVSLRSFASGPENTPPSASPPPQEGTSQAKKQPEEATPGKPEATTSEDERPPNPILEALREQIKMQMMQLRSQSTMLEQTMEDTLPPWQRGIVDRFTQWFQHYFADFIRQKIEKEFELNEFLEGAKDAFWMVHQLMGEEDYATLKTMVSSKLLDAVQATGNEYRAGGLIWRTEIDTDVPLDAQLRRITFWSKNQISEYDKEQAALAPENSDSLAMPTGRWLIVNVQYKSAQKTLITREEDGQVLATLTDKRPAAWTFAAGPLPEGCPVDELDTPFWLVKFD